MQAKQQDQGKLLIIDDDELNATAFARRLERRGFSADVLVDGKLALETLRQKQYDLILLDIVMPETDGISLLKEIRSKYAIETLPVIMVSILNDSTDIFDAFEYGANDYLTKPVNIDAATARIKGQLSATDLHRTMLRMKEIAAVSSLIITYHHELNNPLAIIQGELQLLTRHSQTLNIENTKKLFDAVERITSTLTKIKEISEMQELEYEVYAKTSKMIKLKK